MSDSDDDCIIIEEVDTRKKEKNIKVKKYLQTTMDGRIMKPKEKTQRKKGNTVKTKYADHQHNEASIDPQMQHNPLSQSSEQDATRSTLLNSDDRTIDPPQPVVQLRKHKFDKTKRALSTVSTDLTPVRKVQMQNKQDVTSNKPTNSTYGSTNENFQGHSLNLSAGMSCEPDSPLPLRLMTKGRRLLNNQDQPAETKQPTTVTSKLDTRPSTSKSCIQSSGIKTVTKRFGKIGVTRPSSTVVRPEETDDDGDQDVSTLREQGDQNPVLNIRKNGSNERSSNTSTMNSEDEENYNLRLRVKKLEAKVKEQQDRLDQLHQNDPMLIAENSEHNNENNSPNSAPSPVIAEDNPVEQPIDLMSIWEWNLETGEHIHPEPDQPWKRYVPSQFDKKPRYGHAKTNPSQLRSIQEFVRGMEQNVKTFKVTIEKRDENNKDPRAERALLNRIYSYDIKKIRIHSRSDYSNHVKYSITKETYDLIPYTEHPIYIETGREPPLSNPGLTNLKLVDTINDNARYGHYGPGTFWCRKPMCTKHKMVTATAVVNYGRSHRFHLTKRFFCDTKNVIYMLHCQVCADQSTEENPCYACHVGRCRDPRGLTNRISRHGDALRCNRNGSYQIYTPTQIEGFIRRNEDPNEVRQESSVHFNYEHKERFEAARITILARAVGTPQEQARLEEEMKREAGAYDYMGLGRDMGFGRGGLNRYGAS